MLSREQVAARILALPPDKQAEAIRLAAKIYPPLKKRKDPTAKPPVFRGANLEVQSYRGGEWMLSGPAETGKTWATIWLLDSLLRENPKAKAILGRKTLNSIWSTVLVTYQRIQELRGELGEEPARAYGGEMPQRYTYANKSRLWIAGLDNPNKILSGERDFIYINQAEELGLDDWEMLLTRCTGRGGVSSTPMLFGDCNPGAEDHWIVKRQTLRLFHSKHEDNPSLFDEEGNLTAQGERSMSRLNSLTGIRRARLRDGKWVGAEGLFFEEWDDALHIVEPFEIPADWPVWGAFDYGFSHPTAFGLLAEDNDGTIYLVGEHVQRGWLPPAHCKAIRAMAKRVGIPFERVRQIVAGHDCFQQKGDREAKTIADQYAEAKDPGTEEAIGLSFAKATIDRITGAQELLSRLGNREAGILPRLKLFSSCKRTISAMTRMVHDPKNPEDVLKVDADQSGDGGDDPYDMLRYGVMVRKHEKRSIKFF